MINQKQPSPDNVYHLFNPEIGLTKTTVKPAIVPGLAKDQLSTGLVEESLIADRITWSPREYADIVATMIKKHGRRYITLTDIEVSSEHIARTNIDQDAADALFKARMFMPFMTETRLWAVVPPNRYDESELLGNVLAELLMSFVSDCRHTRDRIPFAIIKEIMADDYTNGSCPVVKGFLNKLDIFSV